MVYWCRFQISVAKIMDTNMADIEQIIMNEFIERDKLEDGIAQGDVQISESSELMRACKNLSLTPFQINVILGLSDPDEDGNFDYH